MTGFLIIAGGILLSVLLLRYVAYPIIGGLIRDLRQRMDDARRVRSEYPEWFRHES